MKKWLPGMLQLLALLAWLSADSVAHASNLELARQLNQAFVEVAEKISPAVVVITVTQKKVTLSEDDEEIPDFIPREFYKRYRQQLEEENPVGQGSGVIVRKDGFIVTNRHVVENAESIEVRLKDGRTFTGTVRGVDAQSDVAVIKIQATGLPTAKFADSATTKVGEFAIAIGAPFQLDYSVTFGHVSAKGRSNIVMPYESNGLQDQDFIQTDANINPGNSGGPLVNIDGEIIGINTLIRGLRTGIGFAVPANLVREVSDQLITEGKFTRAYLGVGGRGLKEVPELNQFVKGITDGVVVRAILPDGPAGKSDLEPSDIITAVDGRPVTTIQELRNEVRGKKIGTTMSLTVARPLESGEMQKLTVKVKAAERVEPVTQVVAKEEKKPATTNPAANLGLSVQTLTRTLARKFQVTAKDGVMVMSVDTDGPAARQEIKPGDVITSINRHSVSSTKEFNQAIKNIDLKKGVLINLVSGDTARFEILKGSGK